MKRIFVTGVSKGIGRTITELFLKNGASLCGSYFRDKKKVDELAEKYGRGRDKLVSPFNAYNEFVFITEDITRLLVDIKT